MSAPAKPILYGDRRRWGVVHADALRFLGQLPDACAHSIVCDPPYGLDIGGEAWDGASIRRVVSRGGESLRPEEAFQRWTTLWARQVRRVLRPGGHLLACGSPRTFHRLAVGIEDAGFAVRDTIMWVYAQGLPKSPKLPGGLGTMLKPAYEPVLLARAPLTGSTRDNLNAWGTGALNIDAARVVHPTTASGYWPADLALFHAAKCTSTRCASGCPAGLLDRARTRPSRLFFCAKATKAERESGCEHLPCRSAQLYTGRGRPARARANTHPTVKPVQFARWLVRLVTPSGGLVLDPFAGSGSTGIAAMLEGRQFLGIEREGRYVDIARARLTHWAAIAAQNEVLP